MGVDGRHKTLDPNGVTLITMSDADTYMIILFGCALVGHPLRRFLPSSTSRKIVPSLIGFVLLLVTCKWDSLYSLATISVNIAIIKLFPRSPLLLSFLWCFGFLAFFRTAEHFGFKEPHRLSNAVQLILTLKLVSTAAELRGSHSKKDDSTEETVTCKKEQELFAEPSIFDLYCYSYCYAGLFTGPFFKYETYNHFVQMDHDTLVGLPWKQQVVTRVKYVFLSIVTFLLVKSQFNFENEGMREDLFADTSFAYRFLYIFPFLVLVRMKFYIAWGLAEIGFITLGLGAYPTSMLSKSGNGPTATITYATDDDSDVSLKEIKSCDYDFNTIYNIDPYNVEMSSSVRFAMRSWNLTVQWWLTSFIYKRLPQSMNKTLKVAAVMGTSAYWHGLKAGYLHAFLGMAVFMQAEDLMKTTVKRKLSARGLRAFGWYGILMKHVSFGYLGISFQMKSYHDIIRYYSSVYYWFHFYTIAVIIICSLILPFIKPHSKEKTK